jgi:hypothetical protein
MELGSQCSCRIYTTLLNTMLRIFVMFMINIYSPQNMLEIQTSLSCSKNKNVTKFSEHKSFHYSYIAFDIVFIIIFLC